jgi:predicted metal-binding protein
MPADAFDYIAVVQCQIVTQRCSGYLCEKAFTQRTGGFADLPPERHYRIVYLDCGGCCGKAVLRKLSHLIRQAKKDGVARDRIVVQLASCITKDNFHSPPCPHLDYLRKLIARSGLAVRDDTAVSGLAERRRKDGVWQGRGAEKNADS